MKIFRVFVKLYTSYNCEERMKSISLILLLILIP